jgi:hypothetical protein
MVSSNVFRKICKYAKCTAADIKLLHSMAGDRGINKVKLSQPHFMNIPVIVGLNAYWDRLNHLGSDCFAADNGQTVTKFYSLDKGPKEYGGTYCSGYKGIGALDPLRTSDFIESSCQHLLWGLPHGATKNRTGTLSLCQGMPVMIKRIFATKCCVTNGAEATVVGWKHSNIAPEKSVLDVLSVKLTSPATPVQLEGLPESVVPIVRTSQNTTCILPTDQELKIIREQVEVVPNFAMTDYGSQGRTCPDNVVELKSCSSHNTYYTALSCSSTADGTVIVQGFNEKTITKGASGSFVTRIQRNRALG